MTNIEITAGFAGVTVFAAPALSSCPDFVDRNCPVVIDERLDGCREPALAQMGNRRPFMPEAGQNRSVISDIDLAIQAFIALFACEEAVKAGLHKIALPD